nr:immunoglobulin heavy chain junction region [Mus musculus]
CVREGIGVYYAMDYW